MKTVVGVFGAGIIAATLLASPANAACAWNGYAWHCWNSHRAEIRHDRARLRTERADVRYDARRLKHLKHKLNRDIHTGSSSDVARDVRKLRRTTRQTRSDQADVHHARRELQQDRWGY
jgi:hypothetical protein